MNITTEQEDIIRTEVDRFTVRAAAGSGKTSVLVSRYIRHVLELGLHPDQIVTITFTRKAAAEMKSRIVKKLRESERFEEAQAAETGPIQTIHSFCERILRENAVEAMIDPEFEVIETAQYRILVERSITSALLAARDESPLAAEFIRRYAGEHAFAAGPRSHSRLRTNVQRVLESLRGSGTSITFLREHYDTPEKAVALWASGATKNFPAEVLDQGHPLEVENWGQAILDRMKLLGTKPPAWLKTQTRESDLVAAIDTCGLMWIALTAWDTLESEMSRLQSLDFTLLESKAVDLLENSPLTCERLQNQCKLVLVDEAQDINPMQYRIIDRIKAPGEMMVGDPQQSVYGFRFADRELFRSRSHQVRTFELSQNHRSDPGILAFIDVVFSALWGADHSRASTPEEPDSDIFGELRKPVNCDGVEVWPLEAKDTSSIALLVKSLLNEGAEPKEVAILARNNTMVNQIAARLREVRIPCRVVGASETFYTRLEVRDLANALEALCDPYEDFPLLATLRSPFVGLSLDAVTYLASTPCVIEALDAPGPWDEDDQTQIDSFKSWFQKGRDIVDRVPAWELLAFLMRETPFLTAVARQPEPEQALANVRKLFAMAASEPELGSREFASRTREVRSLRHKEGEAPTVDDRESAVSVMTIHKSKGLEFDFVVLPDTHKRLTRRRGEIAMDATHGLVVTGLQKPMSGFHAWLSDLQNGKDRAEELRVFYVGTTRARKRLCIVVNEQGGHDSLAGEVAARAGLPKTILPGIKVRRLTNSP